MYACQKPLNIGFADTQGCDQNLHQFNTKRRLRSKDELRPPLVFKSGHRIPLHEALASLKSSEAMLQVHSVKGSQVDKRNDRTKPMSTQLDDNGGGGSICKDHCNIPSAPYSQETCQTRFAHWESCGSNESTYHSLQMGR